MSRNYTEEQTTELTERYLAAKSYEEQQALLKELAVKFDKSESSVRSKLVKLEIYQRAPHVSAVTKKKPETKIQIVKKLENLTGLNLDGLDKSPKLTLDRLLDYIEVLEENKK